MNLYGYVLNDPVNFADPSGTCRDGGGHWFDPPTGSHICPQNPSGRGAGGDRDDRRDGSDAGEGGGTPAEWLAPTTPLPHPAQVTDDGWIVTGRRGAGSTPWYFDGDRWALDPYYEKPWYSDAFDACVFLCAPAAALAAAAAPGLIGGSAAVAEESSVATLAPNALEMTHGRTLSTRAFQALMADIRVNGIRTPIQYVRTGTGNCVVNGNHRLLISRIIGMESVPVQQVSLPFLGYQSEIDLYVFGN